MVVVSTVSIFYAGDTQSRISYKKLVQVDLYKYLYLCVVLSCTAFFLYKNLASNRTELYSTQEICRHVTKIETCN